MNITLIVNGKTADVQVDDPNMRFCARCATISHCADLASAVVLPHHWAH